MRLAALALVGVLAGAAAQAGRPPAAPDTMTPHPLRPPDSAGVPVQVLTSVVRRNGESWVGSYGRGIFVRSHGTDAWRRIVHDSTAQSISLDFVHAIAFGAHGEVWYGTIGNGWGLSTDNGRTWRNWTFTQLGPEWQYVAPDGIVVHGDTVVIGTADGLQVTTDDGGHWVAIGDRIGPPARGPADAAVEVLPSEYVDAVHRDAQGWLVQHLRGTTRLDLSGCLRRVAGRGTAPCALRSVASPRRPAPIGLTPVAHAVPGSARGWMPWFARPIAAEDNDQIDQTYRWGSTMGGTFQAHQGVEFNNPDGTPVHAIGDGVVVYAGPAERGALTVAIRHDTMLVANGRRYFVFSVYYHNSELIARVGDRVHRGDVISRVGHTGRATNDHVHLEVHAAPTDSVQAIVDSLNRYPSYTTNPELWITPRPGTGVIAGTVSDANGAPIAQARVYGVMKLLPRETPFAYAETYGPHNRPHPLYGEQFAVSDVPAGTHRLYVIVDGRRIERVVTVRAGAMAWVDFRP